MVYAKQKGIMMIETLFGINPAAIGAIIVAVISAVMALFFRAIKAGADSEKAKDAKAALDAKRIADNNASLSDIDVKQRIKDKWQKR